jgi:peptidoglycan/xylan/chitin deacetylase (PgdA/CDA1 family)/glycine/D-amino acid oxidase-like deaminating enzyme
LTTALLYDAVVVGAGPYGLSTAAHLIGRGLKVAVFGKPLELWRNQMPRGMRLRSHWWATNISDPRREYGFDRFFRESKYDKCYPEPIDAFIDYGLWFQQRVIPDVDETYVSRIERDGDRFLVTLADGRQVQSAAIVMAIGLAYYAHRPAEFRHLTRELVSHSSEHNDFSRFQGKHVMVIGGGQSALEYSALLHEAGAAVHNVSRRPIDWLSPDREGERTLIQRILAPRSGIAPGWINWGLQHMPYLFNRLPQHKKDRILRAYLPAAVSAWLKDRVLGKVILHEGQTVASAEEVAGRVEATLSDGSALTIDHLIVATGYKIDVERLTMIDPSLRAEIKTHHGAPLLSPWFESSVPAFYFVGATSLSAFGPLYRFVAGCRATGPRVARSIAKTVARPVALRPRVKQAVASAISYSRVDRLARMKLHRDVPFTVSYHRVVERLDSSDGLPSMQISTAMLERHLDWLAQNFRIVSLDDLDRNREMPGSRPMAAVTFDDGYSDIYHHAFPLLKRKGIPAGIFVVTDLVGQPEPPMHERLHALLAGASQRAGAGDLVTVLRDANVNPSVQQRARRIATDPFAATRLLVGHLSYDGLQRVIRRLEMDIDIGGSWQQALRPLTWEMLAEMRESGMTIGSHTKTHAFLTNENDQRVREETEGSRRAIEQRLGITAGCFAYPGGVFNRGVVESVHEAGYRYAFTICRHRDPKHPLLTIPRKMMWERSCLDPLEQFSPAIMSSHAATLFGRFSDCANNH